MEFFKLANFGIWDDFRVLYYIKVTKFVKLQCIVILEDFNILEDFRVLHYIKVTKFVKLANFDILEDFRVLYYIKSRSLLNLQIFVFWKISECYILRKS